MALKTYINRKYNKFDPFTKSGKPLGRFFNSTALVQAAAIGLCSFSASPGFALDVVTNQTIPDAGFLATVDDTISVIGGGTLTFAGDATVTVDGLNLFPVDTFEIVAGTSVDISAGVVTFTTDIFAVEGYLAIGAAGTVVSDIQIALGGGTAIDGALTGGLSNAVGGSVAVGATGTVSGNVANAGTMTSAGTLSSLVSNSGTFTSTGAIAGAFTNTGTATLSGTIGAGVANSGTLTSSAAITGDLANSGAGTATLSGGSVSGALTNMGTGSVTVTGAVSAGSVTNTGTSGTALTVTSTGTLTTSLLTNSAGTTTIDGALVGALFNDTAGTVAVGATGTVSGNVTNAGTMTNAGTLGDAVTDTVFNSGTFTSTGAIAGAFSSTGTATLSGTIGAGAANSGTLSSSAVITGDLANSGAGTTTLSGGSVSGALTNMGTGSVTVTGAVSAGSVTNAGTSATALTITSTGTLTTSLLTNSAGTTTIDGALIGALSNAVARTVVVGATGTVSGDVTNAGTLTSAGTLGDAVTDTVFNSGLLVLSDGAVIEGILDNTGLVQLSGTATIGAGLDNAGATIDMANGTAGDYLDAGSASVIAGTFEVDIDLSDSLGSGTSDTITVASAASGTIILSFSTNGTEGGLQALPTMVVENGALLDFSGYTGLPVDGLILYRLDVLGDDLAVFSEINHSVSSIAGGIMLTHSLMGSLVNRPSDALGSSLLSAEGGACGNAAWARGVYGATEVDGLTSNGTSDTETFLESTYGGYQVGGDFGCYRESVNGWDVAVGGFLGYNFGSMVQSILVTGNQTEYSFDQQYGGLYLAGNNGDFGFDIQLRADETAFLLSNTELGISDEALSSRSTTFSGAVDYSTALNTSGLRLLTQAGFSVTSNQTDLLTFSPTDSLKIEDAIHHLGFVSASLRKTTISVDNTSGTTVFVSGTYFTDFDEQQRSLFTYDGGTTDLTSDGMGSFGEVSFGVSYFKLLGAGSVGAARQFNASLRVDGRMSDDILGFGISAQARIQF